MTNLESLTSSWVLTNYSWNLNITRSWTWELNSRHLEIIKVYNDSYYINQDTFTYLLILIFVWVLLMRTIIKVFEITFNFGFSLSSNQRKIWKN